MYEGSNPVPVRARSLAEGRRVLGKNDGGRLRLFGEIIRDDLGGALERTWSLGESSEGRRRLILTIARAI